MLQLSEKDGLAQRRRRRSPLGGRQPYLSGRCSTHFVPTGEVMEGKSLFRTAMCPSRPPAGQPAWGERAAQSLLSLRPDNPGHSCHSRRRQNRLWGQLRPHPELGSAFQWLDFQPLTVLVPETR